MTFSESSRRRFVDVSHSVEDGMVTYRGFPAPVITDHLSRESSRELYAPGTEFQIGRIEMVANTGTYLDTPFHRYEGREDLSQIPLQSVADLDGLVVRAAAREARAIDAAPFEGMSLTGKAVLVHTGWDRHWRTEAYFADNPFLTADAALLLKESGAALVGIDSLNIDDTGDPARPAHSILLGAGIPVLEHLCNLRELPDSGFKFFAVPAKIRGMGTFPVRAFGLL